jgi:hypothetical protein
MNKKNFEVGKETEIKIFWHDEDGNKFSKIIKGKVKQITNDFIVINNGIYNESFKYSELIEDNEVQPYVDTYDLSIESYEKDIIEKCIDNIKNDITGYVFNNQQAREILDFLNQNQYKYKSEIKNGIYFFKKI